MAAIIALKFRVRGQDIIHGDVPLPLGFPRTTSKFLEKSVDFGRARQVATHLICVSTSPSFVLTTSGRGYCRNLFSNFASPTPPAAQRSQLEIAEGAGRECGLDALAALDGKNLGHELIWAFARTRQLRETLRHTHDKGSHRRHQRRSS